MDKKLITTYGKYRVYSINAEEFRNQSLDSQEFGDYGFHRWYPKYIPKNEIWLADTLSIKERDTLMHNALYQVKELDRGHSEHITYLHAENYEKAEREKTAGHKVSNKSNSPDNPDITGMYHKSYSILPEVTAYLVDGTYVRDTYKTDFVEGGHDIVYKFIPAGEIWLEKELHSSELPYILIHEYTERYLMKHKNTPYNKAHNIARKIEFKYRSTHPDSFHLFGAVINHLSPEWVEKEI